jgi:capsular polysaccharide biosynthesis protein
MNFGRTLKKALKRNDLPTDFVTWNAIVRDRPRWRLLAHSTPSPPKPNQPPANPNAPLPGYGNLAPTYVVPTWYAPLAQAQYAETRATDRAARYAARANRADAPPQQHHLAQGIALDN